jgi:hypothetical protein
VCVCVCVCATRSKLVTMIFFKRRARKTLPTCLCLLECASSHMAGMLHRCAVGKTFMSYISVNQTVYQNTTDIFTFVIQAVVHSSSSSGKLEIHTPTGYGVASRRTNTLPVENRRWKMVTAVYPLAAVSLSRSRRFAA